MALDTIWMAIASVLSVYNISKAVDSHGNVITPEVKMNPGVVRQVLDSIDAERASHLLLVTLPHSNVKSSQGPGLLWRLFNMLVWGRSRYLPLLRFRTVRHSLLQNHS
jgi:hypothetical protein